MGRVSVVRSIVVVGAVMATSLLGTSAVGQEPPPEPAATEPLGQVTLITGDRVNVARAVDGTTLATVEPRADGSRSMVKVVRDGADVYVTPDDAHPFVAAGALDRELFNVTRLLAEGNGDGTTPVIVEYADDGIGAMATPARRVLRHGRQMATLESIDAVAVAVSDEAAPEFWADLHASWEGMTTARRLSAGTVEKVWLDPTIEADLAESVPQIGAGAAWADGFDGTGTTVAVLDTGYDPTHPDLAGQVEGTADFTGAGITDGHGHGTHVAATVAGTGAAADGTYVGVAPGADLLIGKVMGDDGTGMGSWLIDGMEWAVDSGADVVNMSLSTEVTDGSDPLSQAVDALSAASGTLFVATSGNTGPDEGTARAPGNADAALSVAAVDKADVLAAFSSRGPRAGDGALKPDIAAPGVDIVAARAAGTTMGTPVGEAHVSASGTSMAAPHVAGAAAILQQRHPDWNGDRIKATLMGTSVGVDDAHVFGVGAGRVDVARAVRQDVTAQPASVSFGTYPWSEDPRDPVVRTITYRNDGAESVELSLAAEATTTTGAPAPVGMFVLDHESVTVPAGGMAEVAVVFDPDLGDPAQYGGEIRATSATPSSDTVIRTVFGVVKEPEVAEVVVEGINQDGSASGGGSSVALWNLDTDETYEGYFGGKRGPGPAVLSVPVGTYALTSFLWTLDDAGRFGREVAMVSRPEIEITEDTVMLLDAREALPLNPDTPLPTEPREITLGYYRDSEEHDYAMHYLLDEYVEAAYVTPTEPVSRGDFEVSAHWELYAPEFTMTRQGSSVPIAAEYTIGSPRVDGKTKYVLADAGAATPEDLAGREFDGRLALIERSDAIDVAEQVHAVADAGAAAAIIYHDQPGFFLWGVPSSSPIPSFTMEQEAGRALVAETAAGTARLDIVGTAESPYTYDLFPYFWGRVPDTIDRTVDHKDLAEVSATYHGSGEDHTGLEVNYPRRPYDTYVLRQAQEVAVPSDRTEWITPGDSTGGIEWRQVTWQTTDHEGGFVASPRTYAEGDALDEEWFGPVVRPGVPAVGNHGDAEWGLPGFREGDQFTIQVRSMLDGDDHFTERGGNPRSRLYRDGTLVAERGSLQGTWPAVPEPAGYRLELDVEQAEAWWQLATRSHTAWEFRSERPADGERELLDLLQIDYDVSTDLDGATMGRGPTTIGLRVYRQSDPATIVPTGVRVWVSSDEGATWTEVDTITSSKDGSFRVPVTPSQDATSVSLRVLAEGPDGMSIDQTVIRAYGVRARS